MIMKQCIAIICTVLTCAYAQAAENIAIKATAKTVTQTKGSEQDLPRGKSRAFEKHMLYKFDLQSLSTQGATEFSVEWIVLIEKAEGRTLPATMGQKSLAIPFGQTVSFETESFILLGREWRGGPNPGTVEDTIAGYGIRVLAPDGTVVAEKYDPAASKSRIDWKLLQAPKPAKVPPPRRMMQTSPLRPQPPIEPVEETDQPTE
jgi:hypothetical protein